MDTLRRSSRTTAGPACGTVWGMQAQWIMRQCLPLPTTNFPVRQVEEGAAGAGAGAAGGAAGARLRAAEVARRGRGTWDRTSSRS